MTTKTLDEIINSATFLREDVVLCLDRSAQAALAEAVTSEPAPTAAALKKLEQAVEAASITLTLQALPFRQYNELQQRHRPRDDRPSDTRFGYNTLTFFPALVRACVVTPVLSDQQWGALLDRLTDGQFDNLAGTAHELCRS